MIRTTFKFWALTGLLICACLIVFLYLFFLLFVSNIPWWGHLAAAGLGISITGLIFLELRNKVIVISVEEDVIRSTKFLGLGSQTEIKWSDVTGYTIHKAHGESNSTEVLYLLAGDKKIVRLSEMYHQNYQELKDHFTRRCKNRK